MTGNLDIECSSKDMQIRRKYAKMKNIRHGKKIYLLWMLSKQAVVWKGLRSDFKVLNLDSIKVVLGVRYCLKDRVARGGFIDVVKRRCLQ